MSYADAMGWLTDTCTTCGQFNYVIEDEVTDARFCEQHAGPLAWSVCKVNAYTIAVRVSGHLDVPVPDRWHEVERAA